MTAGEMHTGYEWLARQKDAVGRIRWMDIATTTTSACTRSSTVNSKDNDEEEGEGEGQQVEDEYDVKDSSEGDADDIMLESTELNVQRVPLYPLGAVHLPSGHVQTLNNMQPQNIRMARDLTAASTGENNNVGATLNGTFCVTLRAADTGRIATMGTLMRVEHTEELKSYDGSLLGIRVQCVAEGLVEICGIVNPQCWTGERRLRKCDEYLVANVRPIDSRISTSDCDADINELDDIANRLAQDFAVVRSMYACKDGVAAKELPSWAVDAVQNNLPALQPHNFTASEQSFWKAADVWQTLCNTVREARRSDLQSEVNEITIDAAVKKGGPLKLPVHRRDLPQDVQLRLNRMEEEAAEDYVAMGMDPVLDFQALVSAGSQLDRIKHLRYMVARERRRLEAKESLRGVFDGSGEDQLPGREDAVVVKDNASGNGQYNATNIFEGIFE